MSGAVLLSNRCDLHAVRRHLVRCTKNYLIRRVVVATANVTTIVRYSTTYGFCDYLTFSRDGATLFVTLYYAIMKVTIPSGDVTLLVGSSANSPGYADGFGASARFDAAVGIAMNSDESALIVVDQYNNVVRGFDLTGTSNNVTTITGQRSVARSRRPWPRSRV